MTLPKPESDPLGELSRRVAELEAQLGSGHEEVAVAANDLGDAAQDAARFADAERAYRKALAILEATSGRGHPDVANVLNNLAAVLQAQGRHAEEEEASRRALAAMEAVLGLAPGSTRADLDADATLAVESIHRRALRGVGQALRALGRYVETEPFLTRALELAERSLPADDPEVALTLCAVGVFYKYWGKYDRAETVYARAHAILKAHGAHADDDPLGLATILYNLAGLAHARGEFERAEPLCREALATKLRVLGDGHYETAVTRMTLGSIVEGRGQLDEALALYRQAQAAFERLFGPTHPDLAVCFNNLGTLHRARGETAAAEAAFRSSIELRERILGAVHPALGIPLNNLAELCAASGRAREAADHWRRIVAIFEAGGSADHPTCAGARERLRSYS